MKGLFGGSGDDDYKEYRDNNIYNNRNQNFFDDLDNIEKVFENLMINGLFGIPRVSGSPGFEQSGNSFTIDEFFEPDFDKSNFFRNNGFFIDRQNNHYNNTNNINVAQPRNENIKYMMFNKL